MKVVGEREIFASLVELKHHLITEMIQNENEDKKQKNKRYQTSNHDISATAASAALIFFTVCRSGLDLTPAAVVTEITNLRHLEWFYLASDVPSQRT